MNVQSTMIWFNNYVNNALKELIYLKNTRSEEENGIRNVKLYLLGKRRSKETKKILESCQKLCEVIYYDQMRLITELYYILENYIDLFLDASKEKKERESLLALVRVIYIKSQEVQAEISRQNYIPKTLEQSEIIKSTLRQFYATEKKLSKYLTEQELYYRPKRNISRINYKV